MQPKQILSLITYTNIIHTSTIIYKYYPTPILSQTNTVILDTFNKYYLMPILCIHVLPSNTNNNTFITLDYKLGSS